MDNETKLAIEGAADLFVTDLLSRRTPGNEAGLIRQLEGLIYLHECANERAREAILWLRHQEVVQ